MNEIEILQEMLTSDIQVELKQQPDNPSTELRDEKSGTKVLIKGLPNDSIVIRAEKFGPHDDVLKGSKGENKRADFVILSNENTKKWIVCIEIQGGNSKKRMEVVQQLKGAQCFICYCKCLGSSFWKENNFLDGYKYRFVSMTKTKPFVDRRSTSPYSPLIQPQNELHDLPEKFLKISFNRKTSNPSLYFNKLIQKAP